MYLCIEILGENPFHKNLIQSGWSGKDFVFQYNRHTNSHMRAYRTREDYLAERVDLHKAANIWPLLFNLLPQEQIEPHVFIGPAPKLPEPVTTAPVQKPKVSPQKLQPKRARK